MILSNEYHRLIKKEETVSMEDDRCLSRRTGAPLSQYDTEREAKKSARYANDKYRQSLVPYRCDSCQLWHLSPKKRQTPSSQCHTCVGSDGQYKALYPIQKDAETRAKILLREQNIHLKVYRCPHRTGWHLTKN